MPNIPSLTTFTANTLAKAAEVNANFSTIRTQLNTYGCFQDVAATISAPWTFSDTPTFSDGATFTTVAPTFSAGLTVSAGGATITAGGLTVSAGGITVTGNSTITGTLGGLTGLTVASGGASITGNSTVTGNLTVTGTLTGAISATVPAANVTAGTFGGASYTFTNGVTFGQSITVQAQTTSAWGMAITDTTASGNGSVNISVTTSGGQIYTVTGNTTFTFTGGASGAYKFYEFGVKQDGSGGHTVSFANATWPGAVAPTPTGTPGRTDWYRVWVTPSAYYVTRLAADFA